MYLILKMLFIMLIRIKTTSLLSFKLRNPGKYTPFTSCSHIYTRLGVEGIYQTRCIEPTLVKANNDIEVIARRTDGEFHTVSSRRRTTCSICCIRCSAPTHSQAHTAERSSRFGKITVKYCSKCNVTHGNKLKMSAIIRIFAGHAMLSYPKSIGAIGTWKICNDNHVNILLEITRLLLKHLYRRRLSIKGIV